MVKPAKPPEVIELNGAEREAAAWIARLDADPSPELADQFEAWKSRSRLNREAADRLEGLWSELDALRALRTLVVPVEPRRARGGGSGERRRRWAGRAVAAAAAAVAAAVLVTFGVSRLVGSDVPREFETALGKQQTFNLADGSTVQLNTNSALEVRFTRGARDVRLVRGEAFFEVAPDHSRPFTVYAGAGAVQAVGTAFAVRVDHSDLHVTLTRGTIRVRRALPARPDPARPAPGGEAILTALSGRHAEAVVTPEGIRRDEVSSQVVARELSWRQGVLVFDGELLPAVIANVSRYTDVQIEIADPKLRELKIAGYFDAGDVDPMLEALQSGFGVRVERLGPKRVRLTAALE